MPRYFIPLNAETIGKQLKKINQLYMKDDAIFVIYMFALSES